MVRQLLAASRLEAGTLRPRLEVLALAPRIRKAWEALGSTGVAFDLEDLAPGWLAVADPDQLDQVLWALLDNALKYGAATPISVGIRADPTGQRLLTTIADHGPGVSEADRGSLFERYGRGTAIDHPEGTGIGLYVSRELCRAMGGSLELEPSAAVAADDQPTADKQEPGSNTAGFGAAFTIALPAEPPAASES
jgi:signal transduction histidine kinase